MTSDPKLSKQTFDRTAQQNEKWLRVAIPPQVAEFLDIEADDTLRLQREDGDYGKYVSMWNPEQQEGGEE